MQKQPDAIRPPAGPLRQQTRDLLVLFLGPVCAVGVAAPSMLTHIKTAVIATLKMGVRLG